MTTARTEPLSLVETVRRIADRSLDPAANLAACMQRARLTEPRIRAFAHLPKRVPDAATHGPLSGVPVGVKDIMATRDMPTAYGSTFQPLDPSRGDAAIVARLCELGAAVLGKTVTTEYAWRGPGPTGNPWNTDHTPGGSSSGSAAAVATGVVPLALGTQTLGSIIRPAAYCGVVGVKPSHGLLPEAGTHPFAPGLDHIGFFTRTAEDAALALALLTGTAPAAALPKPPRIALLPTSRADAMSPEQANALHAAAAALRDAGAEVVSLEWPSEFDAVWDLALTIARFEGAECFAAAADAGRAGPEILELVRIGREITRATYEDARAKQTALRDRLHALIADFDGILTPPAMGVAPAGLSNTGDPVFCTPWTLLGVPALTIPVARSGGLPLGIQLVAPFGRDRELMALAQWCEPHIRMPLAFPEIG